jgi:hypothetical protein
MLGRMSNDPSSGMPNGVIGWALAEVLFLVLLAGAIWDVHQYGTGFWRWFDIATFGILAVFVYPWLWWRTFRRWRTGS